jgi:hypothetical protein
MDGAKSSRGEGLDDPFDATAEPGGPSSLVAPPSAADPLVLQLDRLSGHGQAAGLGQQACREGDIFVGPHALGVHSKLKRRRSHPWRPRWLST